MNVRSFGIRALDCMYAQNRPRFILSSERVLLVMESEPMLPASKKSPVPEKFSSEEDLTHDAAPTHYQRAILAPTIPMKTGSIPWSTALGTGFLSPGHRGRFDSKTLQLLFGQQDSAAAVCTERSCSFCMDSKILHILLGQEDHDHMKQFLAWPTFSGYRQK